jgi:metal-responsive CopG/Arc/MetJ family transcriptional regulator
MPKKKTESSGSSSDKKVFGVRMDEELAKELKILGIKKGKKAYELIEEAVRDLLKKYGKG